MVKVTWMKLEARNFNIKLLNESIKNTILFSKY